MTTLIHTRPVSISSSFSLSQSLVSLCLSTSGVWPAQNPQANTTSSMCAEGLASCRAPGRGETEEEADRKLTHAGSISQSGWSDRSIPSGSTRCPSQRRSEPASGRDDETRLVVVRRRGRVGGSAQEEETVAIETGLRNPRRRTTTPERRFGGLIDLRDRGRQVIISYCYYCTAPKIMVQNNSW